MGIVEKKRGGGGRRCGSRKNCVAEGEGAVGGEMKNERRNGSGREGENADWYKLLNDRRCERRPLD